MSLLGPVWGLVLLFAIGGWAFGFSSQVQPSPTQIVGAEENDQSDKPTDPIESWREHFATDPIDAITFGLVIVGMLQAGLFWVQLDIMRKGLSDTSQAANAAATAANLAREDFIASHRPRIRIRGIRLYKYTDGCWRMLFVMRNVGGAPANITKITNHLMGTDTEGAFSVFIVGLEIPALPLVIGVGKQEDVAFLSSQITAFMASPIEGTFCKDLFSRIVIEYADSLGGGGETSAFRRYNFTNGSFTRSDDPESDYED